MLFAIWYLPKKNAASKQSLTQAQGHSAISSSGFSKPNCCWGAWFLAFPNHWDGFSKPSCQEAGFHFMSFSKLSHGKQLIPVCFSKLTGKKLFLMKSSTASAKDEYETHGSGSQWCVSLSRLSCFSPTNHALQLSIGSSPMGQGLDVSQDFLLPFLGGELKMSTSHLCNNNVSA